MIKEYEDFSLSLFKKLSYYQFAFVAESAFLPSLFHFIISPKIIYFQKKILPRCAQNPKLLLFKI